MQSPMREEDTFSAIASTQLAFGVRKHLVSRPLMEAGDAALYPPTMTQKTDERLIALGVRWARQGDAGILL